DQAAILDALVTPAVEAFYRDHPDRRRVGVAGVGIEALEGEVDRIRLLLTGGGTLGDVQLFSQLKALGEIRAAVHGIGGERAQALDKRIGQLLEASLQSDRFAQV
ncbi:MAG: ATPase, partial [Polyangiaceae bacterium]